MAVLESAGHRQITERITRQPVHFDQRATSSISLAEYERALEERRRVNGAITSVEQIGDSIIEEVLGEESTD